MKSASAVDVLSALAHEGRIGVFRMLVKAGPDGMPAGEIARKLRVPPNSLSANLNILSNVGLVESLRQGRSIIYTASYKRMVELLGYLMEDCCNGEPEICAPIFEIITRGDCCAPRSARA